MNAKVWGISKSIGGKDTMWGDTSSIPRERRGAEGEGLELFLGKKLLLHLYNDYSLFKPITALFSQVRLRSTTNNIRWHKKCYILNSTQNKAMIHCE